MTMTVRGDGQKTLAEDYRAFTLRRVMILAGMGIALCVTVLWDAATGPAGLSLADIFRAVFAPSGLSRAETVIIWDVRLPYAVMAVLVGAALGLAGAEMQTILNNPLASPYTLGLSPAATLGASLAIALDVAPAGLALDIAVPLVAFLFAMGTMGLILLFTRFYGAGTDMIVLFGIAIFFAMEALVSLVQFVADTDALQQIVFWTMGSLARADWNTIVIVALVLVGCSVLSMLNVWQLTILRTGEGQARALGVPVGRLRIGVLVRVSLLCAVAVAFVGTIGFVGLVGPHISRLVLGEDHRFFLPGAALAGALVLSLASVASKAIVPGLILPVGIVTALAGVPLFVTLIAIQRRGG